MKQELIGFGESVVDFIPVGREDGCSIYKACPGGSVANLCVVAARQGIESAFVGGVGADEFGSFLIERIAGYGVDTGGMVVTEDCGTNLTFVHLKENGERSYSSVNWPGADKMVAYDSIDLEEILDCRVLHVSSNAMVCGKTRDTQPRLMELAKKKGVILSYDVNYRSKFYKCLEEALEVLRAPLAWADIVKVTEEELQLLTGGSTVDYARKILEGPARIVLITRGERGCDYVLEEGVGHVPAYMADAVDTTGAGDCFFGGFLSWMLRYGDLDHPEAETVRQACIWGNKTAALSIQRTGAMSSVPKKEEIEAFTGGYRE